MGAERTSVFLPRAIGVLSLISGLMSIIAAVVFGLLRTIGIGPYHHPGPSQPIAVGIESLALLSIGALLLGQVRRPNSSAQFFGFGFTGVQAVVLAFGFDPASVPLQLASLTALASGVATLTLQPRRVAGIGKAIGAALFGGVGAGLFVTAMNSIR